MPGPETVDATEVTVEAADGHPLAGTLFEATGSPVAALLVAGGTGIPRRYYARFAAHAAARGLATLTLDYRGVGGSAPPSLRGSDARYRDWGQRDIPGAIDWLTKRYPDLPLVHVGHSTGGQQLGLAHNVGSVRASVFVAVSTGYWRGMPTAYGWFTWVMWRAWLPLASRAVGYAPARKVGWGEDLPIGVGREWGAWCLDRHYLGAFLDADDPNRPTDAAHRPTPDRSPFGPSHFHKAVLPVLAYYATDDPISTPANVPPLLRLYHKASLWERWIEPTDIGQTEIGHLGFFRSHIGAPLWDDALDWLQARASSS